MEIKMQTSFFYVHEVKNEWWTIFQSPIATEIWIMLVLDGNSEMYVKLIIFIIHQLLTILENSYLGSYWALNNGSSLIFYLMDLEKWCVHLYLHFLYFLLKIVMLNCWTFREVFICSPFTNRFQCNTQIFCLTPKSCIWINWLKVQRLAKSKRYFCRFTVIQW